MNVNEFLYWEQTSRDTIDLKKIYVDIAGDLVSGVLLSQIIYWNLPNQEGNTKLRVEIDGKLWLAKGREDWWEECRISPKQFDRSIKILQDKGLVETVLKKFNGSPMKHIFLNSEELMKHLEGKMDFDQRVKSILTKGKNPISPKGKIHFDQRVKSLTENTTKTTTKTKFSKDKSLRFNSYEQREYDYPDLEKRLLGWDNEDLE